MSGIQRKKDRKEATQQQNIKIWKIETTFTCNIKLDCSDHCVTILYDFIYASRKLEKNKHPYVS